MRHRGVRKESFVARMLLSFRRGARRRLSRSAKRDGSWDDSLTIMCRAWGHAPAPTAGRSVKWWNPSRPQAWGCRLGIYSGWASHHPRWDYPETHRSSSENRNASISANTLAAAGTPVSSVPAGLIGLLLRHPRFTAAQHASLAAPSQLRLQSVEPLLDGAQRCLTTSGCVGSGDGTCAARSSPPWPWPWRPSTDKPHWRTLMELIGRPSNRDSSSGVAISKCAGTAANSWCGSSFANVRGLESNTSQALRALRGAIRANWGKYTCILLRCWLRSRWWLCRVRHLPMNQVRGRWTAARCARL